MKRKVSYEEVERDITELKRTMKTCEKNPAVEKALNNIIENVKFQTAELRNMHAYVLDILAAMPDALCVIDKKGVKTDCNLALEKLTGLSRKELIGKPCRLVCAEEDRPKVEKILKETMKKGFMKNFELSILTKAGKRIPVLANAGLRKDGKGKAIGVIISLRVITELKKREKELKEARNYTQIVLDGAAAPVLLFDRNRNVDYVNPAFEELTGYGRKNCVGNTLEEFMSKILREEDLTTMMAQAKEVMLGRAITSFPLTVLTKDKRELSVIISAAAIEDARGEVTGAVVTAMDISKIREREAELEEARNYTQSVLDGAAAPVIVFDMNANIGLVNPAFTQFMEYTSEECVGETMDEFLPKIFRRKDLLTAKIMAKQITSGEEMIGVPLTIQTKSGKELSVLMSAAPIRDSKRNIVGSVVTAMDISELRDREKELRETINSLAGIGKNLRIIGDNIDSLIEGRDKKT